MLQTNEMHVYEYLRVVPWSLTTSQTSLTEKQEHNNVFIHGLFDQSKHPS